MRSSVRAGSVRFDQGSMWVGPSNGRTLGVPLAWFPRLPHGSAERRGQVVMSSRGLHREGPDEDILIAGLLGGAGRPDTLPCGSEGRLMGLRAGLRAGPVRRPGATATASPRAP